MRKNIQRLVITSPSKIIKRPIIKIKEEVNHNSINIDYDKYYIGIFVHLFYSDTYNDITKYFTKFPFKYKIYFNLVINNSNTSEIIENIKRDFPNSEILISNNYGKDIGGKLQMIKKWNEVKDDFDYIIFCHDKKSPHMKNGQGLLWRKELLDSILSKESVDKCLLSFMNSNCGMIGSKKWHIKGVTNNIHAFSHYYNRKYFLDLINKFKISDCRKIEFIGGTMFWVKSSIIKNFFTTTNINKLLQLLEEGDVREPSYTHAIERFFGYLVIYNGYNIIGI